MKAYFSIDLVKLKEVPFRQPRTSINLEGSEFWFLGFSVLSLSSVCYSSIILLASINDIVSSLDIC